MKETSHAEGNERRSLLPEAQGEAREVERGSDMPVEHGAELGNGQATQGEIASSSGTPVRRPSYITFTEENAKQALIDARGDIFVASQLLGITAIRLNRAIQASADLQGTVDGIQQVGKGASPEALHAAVEQRIALYRVAGLDALHDLATMPIDQNSAQNQVKLAAAARLAGGLEGGVTGGEMAETFRELSELYQKHAPRLRVTRERMTVELSVPDERVVSSQDKQE